MVTFECNSEIDRLKNRVKNIEEKHDQLKRELDELSLITAKQSQQINNINGTLEEILTEIKKFNKQITRVSTIQDADLGTSADDDNIEYNALIFVIVVLGISLLLSLGASMREILEIIN